MTPKATATGADGGGLTERVSIALEPTEKKALRRAAFLSDASVSAFIRTAALKAAKRTNDAAEKGPALKAAS
jgi:uncharacterized protein (DUF1778 family)